MTDSAFVDSWVLLAMTDEIVLRVDGAVENCLELRFADLAALPAAHQVADVSRYHPKRQGDGVALEAILAAVRPRAEANYLTVHADRDDFHVSVPLAAVRAEGIVVYHRAGQPSQFRCGRPARRRARGQEGQGPGRRQGQARSIAAIDQHEPRKTRGARGEQRLPQGSEAQVSRFVRGPLCGVCFACAIGQGCVTGSVNNGQRTTDNEPRTADK